MPVFTDGRWKGPAGGPFHLYRGNGGAWALFDLPELEAALRRRISGGRLIHTYGVMETAVKLAEHNGADVQKARVAGLLHDYAKALPGEEMLALGRRFGLIQESVEEASPQLLHAEVGAALLREEGLIRDEEVLKAIANHTLGSPGMPLLDKLIWVADLIEPNRRFSGVEEIRALTWRDLDLGLLAGLDHTLAYVLSRGLRIHPRTVYTRNWLLNELERRGQPWAGYRNPA